MNGIKDIFGGSERSVIDESGENLFAAAVLLTKANFGI